MVGSLSSSSKGTAERNPSTTTTVFVVVVAPRVSIRSFLFDRTRVYALLLSCHVRIVSIHVMSKTHQHSCW